MTTITKDYVSDQELARRLELFDQNQRLEEQNKVLEDKLKAKDIAHVEELSRLKHQAGDPIQTAIDILQSHQQYQDKLTLTERQRDLFDRENEELRTHVTELTASGEKLHDQVVHYKDQCEKLLAKHNSEVQKAQAEIDLKGRQLAQYAAELKDLRALNPQRLQKQVKELQKKNKELLEGNQSLRKLANDNQKIRKEHEELTRMNRKLYEDNRRLDAALNKAVHDMNNEIEVEPRATMGDWEFFDHKDEDKAIIVHHVPSCSSRVYWAGQGCHKAPAIPPKIKERAEEIIANGSGVIDYAGGERVEGA